MTALCASFPASVSFDSEMEIGAVTPWGVVETCTYRADGITEVFTEDGARGFHLSPDRLELVPRTWRCARFGVASDPKHPFFQGQRSGEWSMVVLAFEEYFSTREILRAEAIFRSDYAAILSQSGHHWRNV